MEVAAEKRSWEEIAGQDPYWAVLAWEGRKYGGWDVERFFATGEDEIADVMAQADRLGLPARRESALDFGCGLGRLTRALAQRFETALGLDISETMAEKARELNAEVSGCRFVVNLAPDLRDIPDESFDLIYTRRVLQHLPGRAAIEGYLLEFVRTLRPDGLLVFQLPSALAWPVRMQPRRTAYLLGRRLGLSARFLYWRLGLHPNRMTSVPTAVVTRMLESHGARVVHLETKADTEVGNFEESIYFVTRAAA